MYDRELDRLAGAFNRIAPFFDIIRPLLVFYYKRGVKHALDGLCISLRPLVLDIGTGTGTLAGVFAEMGAEVTGIDISGGMLEQARKRYGTRINFIQASAHEADIFGNNSFDLVSAGFAMHEMPPPYRLKVFHEMKRLSRELVLIMDYVPNRNPVISLVESIEKSHYREFLSSVDGQLKEVFGGYKLLLLSHFMGMYLCNSKTDVFVEGNKPYDM